MVFAPLSFSRILYFVSQILEAEVAPMPLASYRLLPEARVAEEKV
jgi:hypothetical protein